MKSSVVVTVTVTNGNDTGATVASVPFVIFESRVTVTVLVAEKSLLLWGFASAAFAAAVCVGSPPRPTRVAMFTDAKGAVTEALAPVAVSIEVESDVAPLPVFV
jgi:hypothetical protein